MNIRRLVVLIHLLNWYRFPDTVSFNNVYGRWGCDSLLTRRLLNFRVVCRPIHVPSIENGRVQMSVCIADDTWCRDSRRIALVRGACVGQRVLLAISAEVLSWLQASNPVLVVGETLAAWHRLDWWVVRFGHDLLGLYLTMCALIHAMVGIVESAASSSLLMFCHGGWVRGCPLVCT